MSRSRLTRLALALLCAALLAVPLSACGRKGPPEVPAGEKDTIKRHYPSQE
jgi:predicted small lipoprotein YifL